MASADVPIEGKTVKLLTILSQKRTYDLFSTCGLPPLDEERWALMQRQQPRHHAQRAWMSLISRVLC